jgi:hypothetical protein
MKRTRWQGPGLERPNEVMMAQASLICLEAE